MCTLEKRGNLFVLTLTSENTDDQHALTPARISSIRAAVAEAKSRAVPGSALVTLAAPGKFFCNGIDLKATVGSGSSAVTALHRLLELLRAAAADIMALPMPTITAVTGHAAGSGLIFAMLHNYIMMTSAKGVAVLPELDVGTNLPDYAAALERDKVGSAVVRRDLVLGGVRVRGEAAMGMGIVDRVYDSEEEVVGAVIRLGEELGRMGRCGRAYAESRKGLYPEVCRMLGLKCEVVLPSKI